MHQQRIPVRKGWYPLEKTVSKTSEFRVIIHWESVFVCGHDRLRRGAFEIDL